MKRSACALLFSAALMGCVHVSHVTVANPADLAASLTPLPMVTGGRTTVTGQRQWPGTYYESAFKGTEAYFRVGPGDVHLKVTVDGGAPTYLTRPAAGVYSVGPVEDGAHTVRIDVISESQGGATSFGGFEATPAVAAMPLKVRSRQIEFIGDSHTVGYGNTSPTRDCTEADVWQTTDTSQGFGALVSKRFDADYQVNAISGRGVVRNYNGGAGDTLPAAYPYILFDRETPYTSATWRPDFIVIALGTNDFSTALHDGEPWATREELHADFETTYAAFLQGLRTKNPDAYLIVWATDMADGEIAAAAGKAVALAEAAGVQDITFLPVSGLEMTGCHYHPDLADNQRLADLFGIVIEAHPERWGGN